MTMMLMLLLAVIIPYAMNKNSTKSTTTLYQVDFSATISSFVTLTPKLKRRKLFNYDDKGMDDSKD